MDAITRQVKRMCRDCWLAGIDADEMLNATTSNRPPSEAERFMVRMIFIELNNELDRAMNALPKGKLPCLD